MTSAIKPFSYYSSANLDLRMFLSE